MYIPPSTIVAAASAIASTGIVQEVAQKTTASFSSMLDKAVSLITPGADSTDPSDMAKQSSFGVLDLPVGFQHSKSVSLNEIRQQEIRQQATQATEKIRLQVNQLLSDAGIDMSQPFGLTTSSDGSIQVTGDHLQGDHPQAAQIQAILSAHPELTSSLNALSGQLSFLKTVAADSDPALNLNHELLEKKPAEQITFWFSEGNLTTR